MMVMVVTQRTDSTTQLHSLCVCVVYMCVRVCECVCDCVSVVQLHNEFIPAKKMEK